MFINVCTHLKTCINKDYSLTRTFVKMLKQFFVKDVALKFTYVRKSRVGEKIQFKNSELCKLIDATLVLARKNMGVVTVEKEIVAAWSDVISNWNKNKSQSV